MWLSVPVSYEEDFEDLSSNADLYVFNDQMAQGYRGVNINTRDNEESLGEMHMKGYIDVSKLSKILILIKRTWIQFTFSHLV